MKKKKNVANAKKSDKGLAIVGQPGETDEQAMARTMMDPALQAAATIQMYANSPVELELGSLIDCLVRQADLVKEGISERIDLMLLSQAHTLDGIANNLFRRAKNQEYMSNLESYLKLGLRAQSQCRATLETLASSKNPKSYLNQTNIAHNQQVNNAIAQSKQLEKIDGERLDLGTATTPIRSDQTLETVGAKHRAEDG